MTTAALTGMRQLWEAASQPVIDPPPPDRYHAYHCRSRRSRRLVANCSNLADAEAVRWAYRNERIDILPVDVTAQTEAAIRRDDRARGEG